MTRRFPFAVLTGVGVAATMIGLMAQSVVLVPGTITGDLALGTVILDQVSVNAYPTSGGNSSSVWVTPGATSGSYSLTVGVPQTGTQTFNTYAGFYTDQYRDFFQTATAQVTVSAGTPVQQNFILTSVGLINASVDVSGGTLQSAYISASSTGGYSYTNAAANYGFIFPVQAANGVFVSGTAYLTDGRQISLPSQTVNVVTGQTTSVSFSVTAPANTGSITGTAKLNGSAGANQLYVYASGPIFRSFSSSPPTADGSYLIDGLVAGSYYLNAYLYLNNYDDYFSFPDAAFAPSRNALIGGSPVVVHAQADQAFINTRLNLTGASTLLPWINSGQIAFSGVWPSAASGGYAFDQLSSSTSLFDSIVSAGTWRQNNIQVSFYRPAPYLYSYFNFYDYRASSEVSVAAGETKSRDLDLPLGELTVSVSVSGGALLSWPSLNGSCTQRDASNNVLWISYVSASASANNVPSAQLTLAAPAGTCSLSISAYVNGSYVSLPASTFQIVAGASQVVDVGGPTLTLTAPAADTIVTTNSVTVTGKATDDVAVASVRVNGLNLSLTPNGNPSDPAEVRFQTTVSALQRGPNTITTVAADTSNPAKTTTDTRTVYYDTAAPSVAFTPANNTSTSATSTQVTGTADDDAGIKKIVVNGNEVSFAGTNNALRPNEVAFATTSALSVGSNSISVEVTDISNRASSATHTITRNQQVPTTMTVAAASGTYGDSTSLSATLTSASAGVAGKTVHFTLGGQTADAITDAAGVAIVANFSIAGQNAGSHPGAISASFAGDPDNVASSGTGDLTVTKATQTIVVGTPAPLSAIYDTTFNTAATGGGSGNSVVITAGGPCIVSSGGSGSATVKMNSGTGTCSVYYNQAGNANYNPATQIVGATAAQKASQAIVVTTSAPATASFGSSFAVAATGGGSGNAIAFTTPSGDGCSDTGPTFTVTSGVAGCQVLYNQIGNGNYNAAPQVTQLVTPIGYAFNGFFQPIDMSTPTLTVWNKATAGQAIPVKWQLTLDGVPVSATNSFVGLLSNEVSCTTGAEIEDAIEEYAPGGSGLTYDGNGNFHFNWKTPAAYKNKCRAMYVSFSDGSTSRLASLKFK